MLAVLAGCWGLPYSVVYKPSVIPLGKTYFSFSAGTASGLDLCRSHVCCPSLGIYMRVRSAVSGRPCFLGMLHPHWLTISLPPLSQSFLSLQRSDEDIQDWAIQGLSFSAYWPTMGLLLVPIYCRRKLLWRWVREILIYGYVGIILLLCSFGGTKFLVLP